MQNVIAFLPSQESFPAREPHLADHTPLVWLFKRDPELLPFVRYLFREHDIFQLRDWDHSSPRLMEAFKLDGPLKERFKKAVGRRVTPIQSNGRRVVRLKTAQRPI